MNPDKYALSRVLVIDEDCCALHEVKNLLLEGDFELLAAVGERSVPGIINRDAPDLVIINSPLVDTIWHDLYPSLKNDPVLCSVPTIILSDLLYPSRNDRLSDMEEAEPVRGSISPHNPLTLGENPPKIASSPPPVSEYEGYAETLASKSADEFSNLETTLFDERGECSPMKTINTSLPESSVIFHAISNPVLILDSFQRIQESNDAVLFDIKKSHSDIRALPCYTVFHGPDATGPPDNCPFIRAMKTKKTETAEMKVELLGRTYQISCTPVLNDEGAVEKVIHVGTDITRIKELEAEQEAFLCQIKKNMVDMSMLNDGIRNPLTVILGRLDIDGCSNPDPIIKQIYRIDDLVTKLDQRWVESLKIVEFVHKHYGISLPDAQKPFL